MLTPEQAQRLAEEVFGCAGGGGGAAEADAAGARDAKVAAGEGCAHGGEENLPRLPERLGTYRIIRLIAQGGMGAVYEARQEHPHRIVAIKVIKRGLVSSRDLRRLHDEAEILGSLRHPGIAQIFDAGTFDDGAGGVPYFVMEFIPDAQPITRYARERELSTRQRLELVARACDAVHYGHQKGVIHRDLKPANILVGEEELGSSPASGGGEVPGIAVRARTTNERARSFDRSAADSFADLPQPKIIDFGVAKSTNADVAVTTMQSSVRELVGTLQYMSPEQCEGNPRDITSLSDVYSLGVVLYELVCGELPYDVSDHSLASAARTIQEHQPPSPGAISRGLRGNIEAIVLKALEKDSAKRYSSAADLAQDIRRHLRGEPVDARMPTMWMKAMHEVARHPIATTAAACVAMVLGAIAVSYGTVWYLNQRPDRVLRSQDMRSVELLAKAGKTIHTWRATDKALIQYSELVTLPESMGGKRLAILGFGTDTRDPFGGSVCAFDIHGDLDTPVWTDRITDELQPLVYQTDGISPDGFGVAWARMMDVFPDEGDELVVSFTFAPKSAGIVRIYNLEGEILYQLCHDGGIHDVAWHEPSGTLLLSGLNSEVLWNTVIPGADYHHAYVLFAVKPERGNKWTKWTTPTGRGHTSDLRWYYALPPVLWDRLSDEPRRVDNHAGEDADRFVRFGIEIESQSGLSYLLDVDGTEIPDGRYVNDEWRLNKDAPPLATLDLIQLPTIDLGQSD